MKWENFGAFLSWLLWQEIFLTWFFLSKFHCIWFSHSGADKDSGLLRGYAVSRGKYMRTLLVYVQPIDTILMIKYAVF
jgi:hypothetical protein